MNLLDVIHRSSPPRPWDEGDNIPWNEPEFSRRMLNEHLNQEHDLASRRASAIEAHVQWLLDSVLGRQPCRVLDLACGPGLYLHALGRRGCSGRGIDFSPASIDHARAIAACEALDCTFDHADLRTAGFGSGYGLALLVYGQLNVFRREEAQDILRRTFAALEPGGRLVLEPQTVDAVRCEDAPVTAWRSAEHGLFSPRPHVELHEVSWDEASRTRTERWHIVDAETASVERHAMSCVAWEPAEFEATLREIGFATVEAHPGMGAPTDTLRGVLYALVAERPR